MLKHTKRNVLADIKRIVTREVYLFIYFFKTCFEGTPYCLVVSLKKLRAVAAPLFVAAFKHIICNI